MSSKDEATDKAIIAGKHYKVTRATPQTLSGNPTATSDYDSPILLEARLSETITQLHQLILTNTQLDDALMDEEDGDLLDALKENDTLIRRKMEEISAMQRRLMESGVNVDFQMPSYAGSLVLQKLEKRKRDEEKDDNDSGLYL